MKWKGLLKSINNCFFKILFDSNSFCLDKNLKTKLIFFFENVPTFDIAWISETLYGELRLSSKESQWQKHKSFLKKSQTQNCMIRAIGSILKFVKSSDYFHLQHHIWSCFFFTSLFLATFTCSRCLKLTSLLVWLVVIFKLFIFRKLYHVLLSEHFWVFLFSPQKKNKENE